jgi:translation initiation factor 2 subunit 1
MDIPEDVFAELRSNIARRLTPQPVKVRADIELTCFSYAGIDAIRSALRAGEKLQTEDIPIQIRLVAPPHYVMISNATDKQGAISRLERAIEVIREEIEKEKGDLVVKLKVCTESSYSLEISLTLSCFLFSPRRHQKRTTWS